jgi:hypothetical protein
MDHILSLLLVNLNGLLQVIYFLTNVPFLRSVAASFAKHHQLSSAAVAADSFTLYLLTVVS